MPSNADDTSAITSAGAKATWAARWILCGTMTTGNVRSPLRRISSKTYALHIPIAPPAKLMIPVPLKVTTNPTPRAA